MFSKAKKTQAGMTLIEMLVVIAIGSLIIIGGLMLFGTASDKQKVSNEIRNLGTIVSGVNALYSSSSSYAGLADAVLVQSGGLPESMYDAATNDISGPWGDITIAPVAADANRSYTVTYDDVPSESCTGLVSGSMNSFESVTVDGTAVTDAATAATECSSAATVQVIFTAR